MFGHQLFKMVVSDLSKRYQCRRLILRGDLAIQIGLKRADVDFDERIALLDDGSLLEWRRHDQAADSGAKIDRLDSVEMTDVLVPLDDFLLDGMSDGDGGRWRGLCSAALLTARTGQDCQGCNGEAVAKAGL